MRRDHSPTTLARQAEELFHALTRLIQRYQFRNRNEICCFDVSVSQYYALDALQAHGEMAVGALAKEMYLDISTLSRILDQLEKKGYVRRGAHPRDRRAYLVSLTKRGEQLNERMRALAIEQEANILRQISPSSRGDVVYAMKQLVEAVDSWRQSSCCVPKKLMKVKH